MITGNATWTELLNALPQKRPLYILELVDAEIIYCSFLPVSLVPDGAELALLPYLIIPKGPSQRIDELEANTSISTLDVELIDPSGELKALSAIPEALGSIAKFSVGFPGQPTTDFVQLYIGRITAIGRTDQGTMTLTISDLLSDVVATAFLNGGPDAWSTGLKTNDPPPHGPYNTDNGVPISSDNPRYISGNPLDIIMMTMQNELGVGQDDPPLFVVDDGGDGASGVGVAGYGVNPTWQMFQMGNDATLINPNKYIDIPGIIAMRNNQFSGVIMEFKLSSSQDGRRWLQDQIMKILGLYWVTLANGKLSLRSIKYPNAPTYHPMDETEIIGIPQVERWPIINMLEFTLPRGSSADSNQTTVTIAQQRSLNKYRSPYIHTIQSDGLRMGFGAYTQMILVCNRIFNRHGFGTPVYTIRTFLKNMVYEIGDFLKISHPQLIDFQLGVLGVTDAQCEIIGRDPNYAAGYVDFTLIDVRSIAALHEDQSNAGIGPYSFALTGTPDWPVATLTQKQTIMYVSDADGKMSDDADGNEIA